MTTKLSKNEMLIFRLCSVSYDWLSNLSNESHSKFEEMAGKFSKNQTLILGLCSTSDHQPSDPSDESCLKYEKMATKFYRFPDGK